MESIGPCCQRHHCPQLPLAASSCSSCLPNHLGSSHTPCSSCRRPSQSQTPPTSHWDFRTTGHCLCRCPPCWASAAHTCQRSPCRGTSPGRRSRPDTPSCGSGPGAQCKEEPSTSPRPGDYGGCKDGTDSLNFDSCCRKPLQVAKKT